VKILQYSPAWYFHYS